MNSFVLVNMACFNKVKQPVQSSLNPQSFFIPKNETKNGAFHNLLKISLFKTSIISLS